MNADPSTDPTSDGPPDRGSNRLLRERRTIRAMIGIYCRAHHGTGHNGAGRRGGGDDLCDECAELHDYAMARLDHCPFGCDKTTCAKCPIHCYKPEMRERVRTVMRFAGPRMLTRHPILAILHQTDAIRSRKTPPPTPRKGKTR